MYAVRFRVLGQLFEFAPVYDQVDLAFPARLYVRFFGLVEEGFERYVDDTAPRKTAIIVNEAI